MNKRIPIDIISGFLGSGKTTLLNALLETAYKGENIAVIENEFGEIDIDSGLLPSDIEITKITGGCVCCTLKVSLIEGIKELAQRFELDRIVIETTGVAKLSDVEDAANNELLLPIAYPQNKITVVNPTFHLKFEELMGAFYNDQIDSANIIYVSRKEMTEKEMFEDVISSLAERGVNAHIYSDISEFAARGGGEKRDGYKHEHDEYKHENDEYKHEHDGDKHDSDGCEIDRDGHNHHHHSNADDEFVSFVVDMDELAGREALDAVIDRIVNENLPNAVFRIKGSVRIEGENKLVQWVQGNLEIFDTKNLDNKLVVVAGRI